jgi:hypothetical protein
MSRLQSRQDVNVILDATDLYRHASKRAKRPAKILVHLLLKWFPKEWDALFRRENNVVMKTAERVCHVCLLAESSLGL